MREREIERIVAQARHVRVNKTSGDTHLSAEIALIISGTLLFFFYLALNAKDARARLA